MTAATVFHSDNGGSAWSGPVIVEANAPNLSVVLDKPHVAVNPGSGLVFVTYLQYGANALLDWR